MHMSSNTHALRAHGGGPGGAPARRRQGHARRARGRRRRGERGRVAPQLAASAAGDRVAELSCQRELLCTHLIVRGTNSSPARRGQLNSPHRQGGAIAAACGGTGRARRAAPPARACGAGGTARATVGAVGGGLLAALAVSAPSLASVARGLQGGWPVQSLRRGLLLQARHRRPSVCPCVRCRGAGRDGRSASTRERPRA